MSFRFFTKAMIFSFFLICFNLSASEYFINIKNISNGDSYYEGEVKKVEIETGSLIKFLRVYFNSERATTITVLSSISTREFLMPSENSTEIRVVGYDSRGKEQGELIKKLTRLETKFMLTNYQEGMELILGDELKLSGEVSANIHSVNIYLNNSFLGLADISSDSFLFSYKLSSAPTGESLIKVVAQAKDGKILTTIEKKIKIKAPVIVVPPTPPVTPATLKKITDIAEKSTCASYRWKDRGRAPKGYMKGMAIMYAKAVCNQNRDDIKVVSSPLSGNEVRDSLTWYKAVFADLGIINEGGIDTLRNAYTLLLGLGMRESSGRHCVGRDQSATNTTAETAEAGIFQTSYNSRSSNKVLPVLFQKYLKQEGSCYLDVFKEGVSCSASNWENWGTGAGFDFQKLSKECPAFVTEYAAVMIRVNGGSKGHYGPLRRYHAEVKPECSDMFLAVQKEVEKNPAYCEMLK